MTRRIRLMGALLAGVLAAAAGTDGVRGQVLGPALGVAGHDKPVRVIYGRFTKDARLTNDADWLVRGEVFIAAPARLVVHDGTRVLAEASTRGALLVERGAQVVIIGSAIVEAPVLTDVELPSVESAVGSTAALATSPAANDAASRRQRPAASGSISARAGSLVAREAAPETTAAVSGAQPRGATSVGTLVLERPAGRITEGSLAPLIARRNVSGAPVTGTAVRRDARLGSRPVTTDTALTGGSNLDGDSRQVVGDPHDVSGLDKPVRVIHGRFTSDLHLTGDTYWVLRGAVFIGAPGRIIIDPGTRVVGELATTGTLIIERGAKIIADGTATQPIVFTSDQPIGQRGRGNWGGLVINGNAPINLIGGVGIGEGDTGNYGGNDPDDNSGTLRYVRVEFAGIEFSPDNELNGIAFQGVGRGTVVDHLQVTFNKDDGIEMFGGTVDVKHVVLTAIGDDSMDWTHGWQGRAQFVIVQQRGDDTDRGIEADNLANNNDLLPRSRPTIYNMTIIGDPDTDEGPEGTQGMELREGTAGLFRNIIIIGSKLQAFRVTGASTAAQVAAGELSMRHAIVFGNGTNLHSSTNAMVAASGGTINVTDPMLVRPYDHADPDFKPAAGSPALTLGFESPPDDGFFDTAVTYRGALSADPAQDWTLGWTSYAQQ